MRRYRRSDPGSRTPLGMAVHACCDGVMARRELAEKLGMSLSGVNSWAAGTRAPSLDDIARIEEACGRPRGWILSRAGYAPSTVDIEVDAVILADHRLREEWRETLVSLYRLAVEASGTRRKPPAAEESGAPRRRAADVPGAPDAPGAAHDPS